MLNLGLFGGSFDPVHLGHMKIAQEAIQALSLDKMLFIPSGLSYHKELIRPASAQERLDMLSLSLDKSPYFDVSTVDISRSGPTYTLDTVIEIKKQYPNSTLWWLMGSDALKQLPLWYRYHDLVQIINWAVVWRNHKDKATLPTAISTLLNENSEENPSDLRTSGKIRFLETEPLPISSTEIKTRIAQNTSISGLVHPKVEQYIKENSLYTALA